MAIGRTFKVGEEGKLAIKSLEYFLVEDIMSK